jgi:methionyl-tRNA synthetase
MEKSFYLTTTLPYVNAKPHIGFALEIVQADVIARYRRLLGDDVVFNTGTDEHGVKIYRKAIEEGKDPQAYADEYAAKFGDLKAALNLSYTNFIRTTAPAHQKAAQELWKRCAANGDIEKKTYKIKYCAGCELEKTDSELVDGRCPIHPLWDLEILEEENYFFKFSNYADKLLALYKERPDFVVPEFRLKEIENFVAAGLQDFSISRLKEKMPWGVPVPGDDSQVMYVWFDALVNYVSTLGWPDNEENFKEFWPGIQFAGKDNLRQQSAMWQAMLLSAGLPPSKQIVIHGFITSGGQKMSKSLGNAVDPFELVAGYGTDALRYWLLRGITPFEDGDFTLEKFREVYNADLANGLGNFAARVLKMALTNDVWPESLPESNAVWKEPLLGGEMAKDLEQFRFDRATEQIRASIAGLDQLIQIKQPFKLVKSDQVEAKKIMVNLVDQLWIIAVLLEPFLPETAMKIQTAIKNREVPILFPRLA